MEAIQKADDNQSSSKKEVRFDEHNLMSTKKSTSINDQVSSIRVEVNNFGKEGKLEERNKGLQEYT